MAPKNPKQGKNPANRDSQLFKSLTRLFSGPIINYRSESGRKIRRQHLDKYSTKFKSASGQQFKKQSYNPLDTIAAKSGGNPLQTFVDALCNAAPMEEITRIKFGAVSQPKAVDSSPSRRLDVALRNLAKGAQQGTHKSKRTLTSCITNELTKAAAGDVTSFAVGKKEELERIAASAR